MCSIVPVLHLWVVVPVTVRSSEPFWYYFGLLGISGAAWDLTGLCSCS